MGLRSSGTPSLQGRILLVDDNARGSAARRTVLEEQGHKLKCVSTAAEALDQLANHKFDLIVTNYRIPRTDGVELIKRIRKQEIDLPVILLSGIVDAMGLNEESTGADAVIQKSAHEVSHLVRTVARLLRQRKPPAKVTVKVKRQAV